MHWGTPAFLNLFLIIPILIGFYAFISLKKKRSREIFGDPSLVERLSFSKSSAKERTKVILIFFAVIFLIFTLARPQIGTRLVMAKRYGVDIMVAIDTSLSMLAEDMKPNRLEKAKIEIATLIDRLKGDRIGILTFAGDSFIQCPLTLDYSAAKMFLGIINVDMMPRPGTAIGDAIRRSISAFTKSERKYKVLILVTDGEDHKGKPVEAAEEAARAGIKIYTIGIGSTKGEPIPIRDKTGKIVEYKKDRSGEVVLTKLDEATLQKIAFVTDGRFYHATGGMELDKIYEEISKMEKKELQSRLFTQYEDRFQYFVGIAIILLCMEFILGERKRLCE